jgi:DNA-binding beta-propeller fold protein YncE
MSNLGLIWALCLLCVFKAAFLPSPSFIEVSSEQNPWNRDTDLLPKSPDDHGKEAIDGKLRFLLATSFQTGAAGTGKVWVIPPASPTSSFVLISGLAEPTGLCYDKNNGFLYVVDQGDGRVLQFQIDTDLKERFILADYIAATIYAGASPYDCSVDSYGNLYIVDSSRNAILLVSYLDLWSGFSGQERVLYLRTSASPRINQPVSISTPDSRTLYFLNNADTEDVGVLNQVPAKAIYLNQWQIHSAVRMQEQPWGLALSHDFAYYSTEDGSLWAYRLAKPNLYLKTQRLQRPRGVAYAQGEVYVADYEAGEVYSLQAGAEEEQLKGVVRIEGVYEVYCVSN